ncbi:helix-turn-helix domain-containing protein [Leifsonia sp. AG29]|uniref:helix-turn-helix domain-containing protein n=1 Tax=Leifsonia sp. AG29 TaxID=2598860 RepID=UPI00131DA844
MGFKATEWAYGLHIAPATKSVLLALAHRADDKTFECFPGQQVLASMTGASLRTVSRALNELEAQGAITRKQRRRPGGSRTSDLCILNLSYATQSHQTESHVTESHETEGPTSPDTESKLTGQSGRHIEEEQSGDHSEDHSDTRAALEVDAEGIDRQTARSAS